MIRNVVPSLVVFCCFLVGPQSAAAQSIFPDKDLEDAVRTQVFEKRYNDEPLTAKDVENISRVSARGKRITNLSGLEKCVSLQELDLGDNAVADLTPIKELKLLQSLILFENKITDIGPLTGLANLQHIELQENRVTDVTPLKELKRLRSLYLGDNRITDIAPLSGLDKLWSLDLHGNEVTDLGPIKGLTRLSTLDLRYNKVADLAPLGEYVELKHLLLDGNQIKDLKPVVGMCQRDYDGPRNFAPFLNLHLSYNPLGEAAKGQLETLAKMGVRIKNEQ